MIVYISKGNLQENTVKTMVRDKVLSPKLKFYKVQSALNPFVAGHVDYCIATDSKITDDLYATHKGEEYSETVARLLSELDLDADTDIVIVENDKVYYEVLDGRLTYIRTLEELTHVLDKLCGATEFLKEQAIF